jgi:ABC-2 type transport system ATP-binding protein
MGPLLQIDSVTKFDRHVKTLDSVSFEIGYGEFAILAGANGSGKSRLLSMIAGFDFCDSGEIRLFGRSLDEHLEEPHNRVVFVSDAIQFPMPISMREMMDVHADLLGDWDDARAGRLVSSFKLDLDRSWSQYSHGQRFQFAFILAICSKPQLLLLDEIAAAMDPAVRKVMVDEIREYTRGGPAALFATHLLIEVQPFADRVVILENGRLQTNSALSEISAGFVKVRVMSAEEERFVSSLGGQSVGRNSDGSMTYIVPKANLPGDVRTDRRAITAEDVLIYHARKGA